MTTVNVGQAGQQLSYGPDDHIAVPAQYEVPVTGFVIEPRSSLLVLEPAAPLAGGEIVLPTNPLDGQRQGISSTETVTTLLLTAGAGDTVHAGIPATILEDTAFELVYVASQSTWYVSAFA